MKKLSVSLLVLTGVTFCLFGEGRKEEAPEAMERATTSQKVEITVLASNWSVPEFGEFVKETYEAEHPNVTVNWQGLPFRPLFESIEIQIGAQSPETDIISVDVPLVASYGVRDYLLPLNDVYSSSELEQWLDEAREAAHYEGKLIAPPARTSTQMLYYNLDAFAEAGITPPGPDPVDRWTWAEVVQAARKLKSDTDNDGSVDMWGLLFHQVNRPYQLLALPESAGGGNGVTEDGLSVKGALTNAGWRKAAKFYYDLFNTWEVAPKGVTSSESQDFFRSGRVAMIVTGDWGLSLFKGAEFEWGVAPHPYFEGGEAVTPTGSWHWGINPYSQKKEEAIELMRFLTLDERRQRFLFEVTARLPTHKLLLDYSRQEIARLGFPQEGYALIKYELANTARHRPQTPGYLEWEDILSSAFEDIRNGADPTQTLQNAEARIESQMRKYRQ